MMRVMASEKTLTVHEFASLGGKARAKKLGKEGLSEAGRKAVAARWAKTKSGIKQDIKKAQKINRKLGKLLKTAKANERRSAS